MEEIVIDNMMVIAFGSSGGTILKKIQNFIDSGRTGFGRRIGNWRYEVDDNAIIHITYHATEVLVVNGKTKEVMNVTTGGYRTNSTHGGIRGHLWTLSQLGYNDPLKQWDNYEYDINMSEEDRVARRKQNEENYKENKREQARERYRQNKDKREEQKRLQAEYPKEWDFYMKLREQGSSWHYRDKPSEHILKRIRQSIALQEHNPEEYKILSEHGDIVSPEDMEVYLRDKKNRDFEERWSRRGADTPNVEYAKLMKFSGLKKKAKEQMWTVYSPNYYINSEGVKIEGRNHVTEFDFESLEKQSADDIVKLLKEEMMLPADTKNTDVKVDVILEATEDNIVISDSSNNENVFLILVNKKNSEIAHPKDKNEEFEERWNRLCGFKKKAEEPKYFWWRVWGLDVWGNDEDGYDVNDRSEIKTIAIIEDAGDQEIIRTLAIEGILRVGTSLSEVSIGGDDMIITVDETENGKPILTLEKGEQLSAIEAGDVMSQDEIDRKNREFEERWSRKETVITAESILV